MLNKQIWEMVTGKKDAIKALRDVSLAADECYIWFYSAKDVFPNLNVVDVGRGSICFIADDIGADIKYEFKPSCGCCPDPNLLLSKYTKFKGEDVYLRSCFPVSIGKTRWTEDDVPYFVPLNNLDLSKYNQEDREVIEAYFDESRRSAESED